MDKWIFRFIPFFKIYVFPGKLEFQEMGNIPKSETTFNELIINITNENYKPKSNPNY